MVAFLAIKQVAAEMGPSGPAFEIASQTQTTIAFAIFTLPLMLILSGGRSFLRPF